MPSSPIRTKCSYRVPLSIYFSPNSVYWYGNVLPYIDSTKRIRYICVSIYMHIYMYVYGVYICIYFYIYMYCLQRTHWASQAINVRCIRSFLCISYSPETRLESRITKVDLYFILSFIKLSLFHIVHTVWYINQSLLSEYGPDHGHPVYYSCAIYVDPFHFLLTVWYVNQGLLSEYGPDHKHRVYIINVPFMLTLSISCTRCDT